MKHARKLAGILLAMVMALALALPAFADETYTITIKNATDGHTYEAYQIFSGDLSGDTLSNIEWGNGVTNAETISFTYTEGEGESAKTVTVNTAADIAKALQDNKIGVDAFLNTISGNLSKDCKTSSGYDSENKTYTISNLVAGYYLVKDKDKSQDNVDGSYTSYILKVVKNQEVEPKADKPSSEKKVKDTNDSTGETTGWQDSADYDIGDDVPFQLKATIAKDYDNYKVYKLTFHDVESAGLTFKPGTVVVKIDGHVVNSNDYTVSSPASDGDTFDVSFTDLKTVTAADNYKAHAGSVITVEYSSTLNDRAVLGSTGNPNTMHITYSNNPNDDQGGENGKTPDDKVIVFTYKVVANKVDQDKKPLTGAGFTLYKKNASGEYVTVGSEVKGDQMTTFEWTGLDDGDYKISETTTPAGYNTAADIKFTITAAHDVLSDNPTLTSLSGDTFTGNVSTGAVSADIENNKGSTLPETGGIGTTIFYVVGSILVLAAVVLLITKKRMSEDK